MWKTAGIMIVFLFILGCAVPEPFQRPARILNCEQPEGKRYVCFSDEECTELFKGYSIIFKMRVEEHGETHPVIHMNIYADHTGLTLVGRIEGGLREHPTGGKRWYQKMWTIVCNDEGTIVHENYAEGFRTEKSYEDEIAP